MSIWKDTRNPKTKLTSSSDFLQSSEITQACKDSYSHYTDTEDPTQLPLNQAGYPQTNWTYVDNEAGFSYKATYNPDFGWGVMRNPADKSKPQAQVKAPTGGQQQLGAQYVSVTNGSKDKDKAVMATKLSPKSESSLGIIAEEVVNIRRLIEILAETKIEELIKPASTMVQKHEEVEEVE